MTIARKGSRPIKVDGVTYRWSVRPRPTYSQGLAQSPLTFAVVSDESPGSTLVVTLDVARPDNWVLGRSTSVTPATVEGAIRQALLDGWCPEQIGSAFPLQIRTTSNDA